ncbi:MAG: hypothetical protein CL942_15770 [Desulfovibrio sp.]|nr:hypothetical protein [Desulfovibrio sp.]MBC18495.1 hypothetical protein [Desulfovibrio sp.]
MTQSHSNLETTSPRAAALMQARDLVDGDRDKQHGDPTENMTRFAELIRAYLYNRPAESIEAVDAAAIGVLHKMSRNSFNPYHLDNWLDIMGYASIAYEIAATENKKGDHLAALDEAAEQVLGIKDHN